MKEIRETKLVEQTTIKYIASDGKVFIGENTENDCIVYERRLNEKQCQKEFEQLIVEKLEVPFINAACGEIGACIVELKSKLDFQKIEDYLCGESLCLDFNEEIPENYPIFKILITGEDWGYFHKEKFESVRDSFLKCAEKINNIIS